MQPLPGAPSLYPQPGEVLDEKYRVEHLLGEGGMGAVARATHLIRRAPVALKFMSPWALSLPGAVERFVNEGVAASQIDSDHVVKVFDVGRLPNGTPYLVMEFLDGRDLAQLLEAEGPMLAVTRAVHFAIQMLRALQAAHAAGIIHRDMKPSNCFIIDKDGERDVIKLVDFGISKVRLVDGDEGPAANLTRTNSALGTPLYMSPEQARSPRDVDHRTDLYSVGAILYEMLCGRTPYSAESGEYTELLFKIFTSEPEPLRTFCPDLPESIAAVVHRALERDPGSRFASASEMAEALAPFSDGRSTELLSRLRRSMSPPPMSHVVLPASIDARSLPEDAARARTLGADASTPLRPGKVPTDVGVTRESIDAPTVARADRGGLLLGGVIATAAVVGLGAVAAMAVHAHRDGGAEPDPRIGAATRAAAVSQTGGAVSVGEGLGSSAPGEGSANLGDGRRPTTVPTTDSPPAGAARGILGDAGTIFLAPAPVAHPPSAPTAAPSTPPPSSPPPPTPPPPKTLGDLKFQP
jgi:serine/threonine-protein kinase